MTVTNSEFAATTAPHTEAAAPAESLTPNARQWWRRARGWVWLTVILLVVGALAIATYAAASINSDRFFDPESATPQGTKALVQTLDARGVEFTLATSTAELGAALATDETVTLLVEDPNSALDGDGWAALRELDVDRLVITSGAFGSDEALEGVASFEGQYSQHEDADGEVVNEQMPTAFEAGTCVAPFAQNAPVLSNLGGREYAPEEDAAGCYPVRDGYALVIGEVDGMEIVAIGATTNLTNEHIAADANAALGVNLLGANEQLVWYTPNPMDFYDAGPSFASYIPQWLLPATILLFLAGTAAVLWRGRRFGPLVTERLPVTVPANETIEGRARLYDASNSRLRALDSIRVGTIARLADLCGLGARASTADVIAATAGLAGVSPQHAGHVLYGAEPASDAELVELSNAAAELERRVRATTGRAAKPSPTTPTNQAKRSGRINHEELGDEHDR